MRAILSAFLAVALVTPASLKAAGHKISPDAPAPDDSSTAVSVLIQWKIPIGTATGRKVAALGGSVLHEMKNLQMGQYSVPPPALTDLDSDPDVKYVSVDRTLHRKLAYAAAAINAPYSWNLGFNGAGIGVAVLDSGMDKNDDLGLKADKTIVYTEDFTTQNSKAHSYGHDWYGHGEHIAGIIASNAKRSTCGNCTLSMAGIAPGASLINLKVLDEFGHGTDSAVVAAIDEAIALKSTYNIRVINVSPGRPVFESYTLDPLCQAAEAAWNAGMW